MKIYKLLILILLCNSSLNAEIISVIVRWNAGNCKGSCKVKMEDSFKKVPGVQDVTVDTETSSAQLKWKSGLPFNYNMVNMPMHRLGVGIYDVRVKVRGRISEEGKYVYLTSEKDRTKFILISDDTRKPNPNYMRLAPATRLQLLGAGEKNQIVVIDGVLYEAYRSPPLFLVVERINIEKEKTKENVKIIEKEKVIEKTTINTK